MKVSAKHCDTVAQMGIDFSIMGHSVDIWHRHSSMLPENRDAMLRSCVETGIDVFISIDSDTYLDLQDFIPSLVRARTWLKAFEASSSIHFVAAPVKQRDGKWNVTDRQGEHLRSPSSYADKDGIIVGPRDSAWTGVAFAIYNCAAYKSFASDEPMYVFGYDKGSKRWIGEDCYHAMKVGQRGNFIIDTGIVTGHDV